MNSKRAALLMMLLGLSGGFGLALNATASADTRDDCFGKHDDLGRRIAGCTKIIVGGGERGRVLAHINRGVAYSRSGEPDLAIKEYTKAIEFDPGRFDAYHNRGMVFARKSQFDRAFADFDKAIELKPSSASAHLQRGAAYGNAGMQDRAISDFDKAIQLDPKFSMAYEFRGLYYEKKGDLAAAEVNFRKALELAPDNRLLREKLAAQYPTAAADRQAQPPSRKLRGSSSNQELSKAARSKPSETIVAQRGSSCWRSWEGKTVTVRGKVFASDSLGDEHWYALPDEDPPLSGKCKVTEIYGSGRLKSSCSEGAKFSATGPIELVGRAKETYEEGVEGDLIEPETDLFLHAKQISCADDRDRSGADGPASLDQQLGDLDACAFAGWSDDEDDDAVTVRGCSGIIETLRMSDSHATKQRRFKELVDAYGASITDKTEYGIVMSMMPEDYYEIYNIRGHAFSRIEEYDRAMADFDAAIQIEPTFAPPYLGRGYVYIEQRDWQRAIEEFNRAIKVSPRHSGAYLGRGKAYLGLKDYRRALADFDQSIQLYSKSKDAFEARGEAYKAEGNLDRAIADYTKAIELNPKSMSAYLGRMDAYYAKGDRKQGDADKITFNKLLNGG